MQSKVIGCILAERGVIVCATTGSGKTASFLVQFIALMITEGSSIKKKSRFCSDAPVSGCYAH